MSHCPPKLLVSLVCLAGLAGLCSAAQAYSWQQTHAEVTARGDLEWAPQPFVFEVGDSVRYVDYEGGDDRNPGTSRDEPWKHHPWDPQAAGQARAASGVDTYVFKRGVTYRGALTAKESGRPGKPIRLTSDPSWGQGEAVISGSEVVTGWRKGSQHVDIPEADRVWVADLDYAPRRIWAVDADDSVTRIPIARTPNWEVSDLEEVLSEWWQWEQPQWWIAANRTTTVDGKKMHLGIDKEHVTEAPEYYRDAIVWTEWAIVMGTPFPTKVAAYDPEKRTLAFEGRWYGDSGQINAGNRYFLEDKPQYLDSDGEFWFERRGDGGRLHLRLPGDRDPNTITVEAARRYSLIQDLASANSPNRLDIIGQEGRDNVNTTGVSHIVISGLTFRFNDAWWDYHFAPWLHKEVDNAGIRLLGTSDDVRISNCRFEYISKAVRIEGINNRVRIGSVVVSDNLIQYTDDAAMTIGRGAGRLADVRVLRNNLFMIGLRPFRQSDAHALVVAFPETMEIAGNMLKRCYGSGIFVHGGKPSGAGGDVPLSRNLIHHNKAEQTLLATNDWGGIETWQGGPFYVYNNISANPNGYWNWAANKPFNARLGFAYYLDGSFKNYLFNNIAWGLNNDADSKLCSAAAFYEAVSTIHNSYFNNTVYRFATGSNWSPSGGH
ncbi:MAG: right-handed parallel beta-helix repeat-containing protein, partial [Candidatus Brocadiae bacterium]|nr:right-handed parallel beta-helix repeat-containing protein [Candidatus Brocadiia bacterium]